MAPTAHHSDRPNPHTQPTDTNALDARPDATVTPLRRKRAPAAPTHRQRRTPPPHTGRMWVGPTSEQTRRLVAESRLRQGLLPRIENPAVIESLGLFLRNTLATLPLDREHDRDNDRRAA
ncbi:hypothetical protein [Nocardia sp. AB354]|uniref:hypothetical protein n=1 Tax=Nocardia sp. AB354 TaxID=3413283 RepID=UPI003C192DBD